MNYTDALSTLEMRKVGTDYNATLDKMFFFTELREVGEVRLLVENEEGELVDEFEVRSPEESMAAVRRYCTAPMFVNLEEITSLCEPPYGLDEQVDYWKEDKEEDDKQRYNELKYMGEKI